jgi:adenylate cyclase
MAEDEGGTIRTLTDYREAIAMLVRQHRGRVVDSPGDNLLAEFPTALDAVQGAVEIQRVIQARNADQSPDRRMEFRIGVHLGDISVEGERVYGDGVNVAARLEGLAQPGGVCISATVYEQVEKKLNVDLEDLGEQTLKNIARPVHVYGMKLLLPGTEREEPEKPLPGMEELTVPGFGGRPAIAVLPFDNLSGDRQQEYFADGIAEDLMTRLSTLGWLPVIARNSSFVYKGKSVDVKKISRELGAGYLVEGSVRKEGDRVRISAQLINATTAQHVWAERYDHEMGDLFSLQDDIARAIAESMYPELLRVERDRVARNDPRRLGAYGWMIRGIHHIGRLSQTNNAKARRYFQQAIEAGEHLAQAYAYLAFTHHNDLLYQWSDSPEQSIAELERAARKSIGLNAGQALGHQALGLAYRARGHRDKMIAAFERGIELDPSQPLAHRLLGLYLALAGNAAGAIENLRTAMHLSPDDRLMHESLIGMALAHGVARRYEEAIDWAQRSAQRTPHWVIAQLVLAGSYAAADRMGEARAAVRELRRLNPNFSLARLKGFLSSADPVFVERSLDALRKAGLKE